MTKYDLSLRDYWLIIKKRKLIVIFTFLSMTIFSFIFSTLIKPNPIYKTSATLKFEVQQAAGVDNQGYRQGLSTVSIETQAAMIKSYFTMELVAKILGFIPAEITPEGVRNNPQYINVILDLKSKVETEQDGASNLINVITTSNDPKFAQKLANTIAQAYKEQHALDFNRKTIESKKFIENQRVISLEKLVQAEEAVKHFKEKNQNFTADPTAGNLVSQVDRLVQLYDQQKSIYQRADLTLSLLNNAENRPMTSDEMFHYDGMLSGYGNLADNLVQLLLQRDMLLLSYTDKFPKVIELKNQIRETVMSMRLQLLAHTKTLKEDMEGLKRQIDEKQGILRQIPEMGLELVRLERNRGIALEVYTLLEKRYQEALIAESEILEVVQIVKPALEPRVPINPTHVSTNVMLGMIIGLVLGIVFAFLIETFDTSIGAIEEIETLMGTRVIGMIPFLNMEDVRDSLVEGLPADVSEDVVKRHFQLISHFLPTSTLAENYRALRTNFNFLTTEREAKTIVITSTYSGEGKTTVTANLAITLAQSGHKVLLIDGDFRRPVISRAFGIEQKPGLTDIILGNYEWQQVLRSVSDLMMGKMNVEEVTKTPGLDNLYLMTSGSKVPNPSELISSKTVTDLIQKMRADYEFVLIDAPPVLATTDAAVWSSKVDGVVIVYQVGRIARGALLRTKAQMDNIKAHMLGVVLNGLKIELSSDFTHLDKYNYYYGDSDKNLKPETIMEKLTALLPGSSAETLKTYSNRFKSKKDSDNRKPARIITKEDGKGKFRWLNIMILVFAVFSLAAGVLYMVGMSANTILSNINLWLK
ncbi:MAG: polysaccharide biosynthesis tyrosine autokinase [Deltaproteobacteria bacterium]|nr:polysaccharide biosynthesis tyrosine autokinase [Deltaproteobacteria bacterium]